MCVWVGRGTICRANEDVEVLAIQTTFLLFDKLESLSLSILIRAWCSVSTCPNKDHYFDVSHSGGGEYLPEMGISPGKSFGVME